MTELVDMASPEPRKKKERALLPALRSNLGLELCNEVVPLRNA
jgi:hypothetical protein